MEFQGLIDAVTYLVYAIIGLILFRAWFGC
jgi:hypothetical protein